MSGQTEEAPVSMAPANGSTTFSVTVLGSGYVVCVDGTPRIIVDRGGGTFERIGRAHLDLSALDLILLTHLHIDRTSDLPALIVRLHMNDRQSPVTVMGPMLFGSVGAWQYMNTFVGFGIDAVEAVSDPLGAAIESLPPTPSLRRQGVSIEACAVPIGMMPSVGYRINYRRRSVVFSGDISRPTTAFLRMASNCSLLVHDVALPQPSVVALVARKSNAKALLLSHFMPAIRDYHGRIELADDLSTYEIE
jgi:ribonuclease BN (tRNA processing enzyme)